MTTREDVLRKALERVVLVLPEGHASIDVAWARNAAVGALAEADALPSDAERWQQVRDLLSEWNCTGDNYGAWRRLRDIVTGAAL